MEQEVENGHLDVGRIEELLDEGRVNAVKREVKDADISDLAVAIDQLSNDDGATRSWRRILEMNEQDNNAYLQIERLLEKNQRHEELVEIFNKRIEVESNSDGGTTFIIRLPLKNNK